MPPIGLVTVPRVLGKNPPGKSRLYIMAEKDVDSIPAAVGSEVATDIVPITGANFVELEIEQEYDAAINVEEPESEGSTGKVVGIDTFLSGGSDAAQIAALEALAGIPCVVVAVDKAGVQTLVGEQGRGIRLISNYEDGRKPGERRGWAITGKMDYNDHPYIYSGLIPLTPAI